MTASTVHRPVPAPEPARRAAPAAPHPVAHDALVAVAAPGMAVCDRSGQLRGLGVQGLFRDGRRLLARSILTVGGIEPEPLGAQVVESSSVRFTAMHRFVGDPSPDPALFIERTRHADGREDLAVRNCTVRPVRIQVELLLGTDLAALGGLRAGQRFPDQPARVAASGLGWRAPDGFTAHTTAHPAPAAALAQSGVLRWDLDLPPGGGWTAELRTSPGTPDQPAPLIRPDAQTPWSPAEVRSDDVRIGDWLRQSLHDLRGLLLTTPEGPRLLCGGAPWQLVPTGRDSLWAARMLLSLGTGPAADVLHFLAARQGVHPNPQTGEVPGRIPHSLGPGARQPRYDCDGTTALFVTLLAEARRWGLPEEDTERLLPHLERALGHLSGRLRPGGFVTLGGFTGPAPCELQGQVYEAAVNGAQLLDAYNLPGAEGWRERAAGLADRFRTAFLVEDAVGRFYAAALDPAGRPVAVPTAAMGQLPGTGILDGVGCSYIAARLLAPDLHTGYGLRSTSSRTPAYQPLALRGGVVRTHDTCTAAAGLASAGYPGPAQELFAGLLEAAPMYGHRLPEAHSGERRLPGSAPLAHPLACRPSARTAAALLPVLTALAGIRPEVPDGRVTVRPPGPLDLGELELRNLTIAGEPFTVRINRAGQAVVEEAAGRLRLAV